MFIILRFTNFFLLNTVRLIARFKLIQDGSKERKVEKLMTKSLITQIKCSMRST